MFSLMYSVISRIKKRQSNEHLKWSFIIAKIEIKLDTEKFLKQKQGQIFH
jgi:hypothetical protein